MKLGFKVGALIALILASFLMLMVVGLTTLRIASSDDNQARVEQLFKSTFNVISEIEKYVASGKMTEAQAKELATQVLRENKYHQSEYVYVADENMNFIAKDLKRHFLIPLKKNRNVARSKKKKDAKEYQAVENLKLEQNKVYKIYLESVDYPLLLTKLVLIVGSANFSEQWRVMDARRMFSARLLPLMNSMPSSAV